MSSAAVTTSRLQSRAARIGMAGKGVLYVTIGLIAGRIAFGTGGGEASQTGAIRTIGRQPFGRILLIILAVALAGYAVWRLIQALGDPDEDSALKAVALRVSYMVRSILYVSLCVLTIRILTGSSGASGDQGSQQATAVVLGLPGGQWLVGAAGIVGIAVGLYQAKQVWTADFMDDLAVGGGAGRRRAVERLGRAGHAARSVIYVLVGVFLIRAAVQYDPREARGLDGALQEIAQADYGTWLLFAVALGLVAYGAYAFVAARYLADPTA